MPEPIVVALIALGAALLGALVQAILASRFEHSKFVRDQRRESYEQFLTALAEQSIHASGGKDLVSANAKLAAARPKIALFGSKKVVALAARLFTNTNSFQSPEDQDRYSELILAMRRDSVGRDDYNIKVHLMGLLFASKEEEPK